MKLQTTKQAPPKDLKAAGKALWCDICAQADSIEGTEPMLAELCRLSDRLAEIRETLKREGLMIVDKRHPLVDAEMKCTAQYQRVWRTLGLAEAEPDPVRGKGRPLGR